MKKKSNGRFSLVSPTDENQSVIYYLSALVHETGQDINIDKFSKRERTMKEYERLGLQVSSEDDRNLK